MLYTSSRISRIFSIDKEHAVTKFDLIEAEAAKEIPSRSLLFSEKKSQKSWSTEDIPLIAEKFGFLEKKHQPIIATFFITKGGVLKSSLCLNFARICALHGLKTCVIGLDMQADITANLGYESGIQEGHDLNEALQILGETKGLTDLFFEKNKLQDIVIQTQLPYLYLIPETTELVVLEKNLTLASRREYWLRDKVITHLKNDFDVILFDASPNWNNLITNALVASDFLISPVECKINNFRNLPMFQTFIADFKRELNLNLEQIFVPTRLSTQRKLSQEILSWYQDNLSNCTKSFIKDSVQGEEASAMKLSVPEYSATTAAAFEMNQLIKELWSNLTPPALTDEKSLFLEKLTKYADGKLNALKS